MQSLALSCYDEALALPTEEAQQLALRSQQIIAEETGAADTVDPLAGSYYVEWLTERARGAQAQSILDRVEDIGGAVSAVEGGYMQSEIQEASVAYQREVESGERIVVGVNQYVDEDEDATPIFRPNTAVIDAQLEAARAGPRRPRRGRRRLLAGRAARGGARRREPDGAVLDAVRSYATLGEMCGVLREEWGEYVPPTVV